MILAQTWVCYCKASEGDSKLSHVGTTGYFCRTPLMPVECHMGMVYHPHRTFCTTGALYFSADHTSGLLLERLLDCIIVLYCLLSIYIYTGNSATSAVLFYISAVNLCLKFFSNKYEKLFSVQKACLQQGLLELPAAYQANQAGIWGFLVESFTPPFSFDTRSSKQMNPGSTRNKSSLICCWDNKTCCIVAPFSPVIHAVELDAG